MARGVCVAAYRCGMCDSNVRHPRLCLVSVLVFDLVRVDPCTLINLSVGLAKLYILLVESLVVDCYLFRADKLRSEFLILHCFH